MSDYLAFAMLGLGAGAVYAALALGLVLTYKGSGVINFAHGAMAMFSAYIFLVLWRDGDLLNPLPGPSRIHIGHLPFAACLLLALLVSALLAVLLFLAVFRPLRNAPPLAKVVSSIGVMLVLQAAILIRGPKGPQSLNEILPSNRAHLLGIDIARDRLWLALVVIIVTVAMVLLSRFTRFGLATQAVSQNEKGAIVLGYSPTALGAANWILSAMVAALIGILAVPITGVDALSYTLLIVPALGAAFVGSFTSIPISVAAGLALGIGQSVMLKLILEHSWLPRVGLTEGLPFLVIVAAMAMRGHALPERGAIVRSALPRAYPSRSPGRLMILAAVAVGLLAAVVQGSYRVALITSMIGVLLCLSIVVITGFLGQISLAQMMFAGVGGFAVSKLTTGHGVPFPIAPLLAATVAMVVGVVMAIPALRVRGVNLAILTIGAAVAVQEFVFKNPSYTGGLNGSHIKPASLFGIDLNINGSTPSEYPRLAFALMVGVFVLAGAAIVVNLRRSATGRQMLAVRSSERAAEASGIDVRTMKLFGFGLSAFIAGLGGALIGYQHGELSYESFGVLTSTALVATAYIGGIANVAGAVAGGMIIANGIMFVTLNRYIPISPDAQNMLGGIGLLFHVIRKPAGAAGELIRRANERRVRPAAGSEDGVTRAPDEDVAEVVPAVTA